MESTRQWDYHADLARQDEELQICILLMHIDKISKLGLPTMDSDSRVLQSLRRISTSPYTQALSNVITVLFNGSSSATKGFLVCIGVFFNLPSLKVFHAERVSDNNTEGSCVIPVKASKVEELTLDLCRIRGSTICQLIQGTQAQQRLRYRNSGLGRMNFSLISSCVEESAAYDNSMARPQFDSNALFR